jgi:xanthine dehydrogenase accessory factor
VGGDARQDGAAGVIGAVLARRADALVAERLPFVLATVVRAQRPTSVRAGDAALVLGDGTIEGFVGGACAESAVRLQALRALETGEATLLRIVPGDPEPAPEGAVVVSNPCLSGGALEIFLEPRLPAPRMHVVGDTPIGFALVELGERIGLDAVMHAGAPEPNGDDAALVVASHGRDEEESLVRALEAGVPYVGLVASRTRGAAVTEELRRRGVGEEALARLRTPAGLDIGARGPAEIALSILAEVIASRRAALAAPPTAVDPVCGMTVAITPATPSAEHAGGRVWFCCEGCRERFVRDHAGDVA